MKNFNRTIQYLGVIGLIPLSSCVGKTERTREVHIAPNVIYVFPDQMRNCAMEFWHNENFSKFINFTADPVKTPNLNRFAEESVVFTSAMSNCPLSTPHRGSLLTGMYPHKSGAMLNCNSDRPISSLRDDVVTISDVLRDNGYECAYIGKYHLDFPTPNDPQNPGRYVENRDPVWDAYTPPEKRHGFNFWYSYGTFDDHKHPHYWDTKGNRHEIDEYSPKHEADVAIAYLENKNNERDATKPFFLVVSMNPPHSPYHSLDDCRKEDYELYKDKSLQELLIRPNVDLSMGKAKCAPFYFAHVTGVDREFGRILEAVEKLGLAKNTIVVFSSDHGETMCSHAATDPKNLPYAEAMNVPFLIRYPDKLVPRTVDYLLSSPDIMPTLLGLCGFGKQIPRDVQGYDFSKTLLTNKVTASIPKSVLYIKNIDGDKNEEGKVISYFPVARGVKTSKYTLVLTINKKTKELDDVLFFDDEKDPYQMNNLDWNDFPEVRNMLLSELSGLLKKADDPWYRERILNEIIPY